MKQSNAYCTTSGQYLLHCVASYAFCMNDPAERLRAARIKAGYPDAATAARALDMSVPTYVSHENGSRGFRADRAEKYARRFKVSPEWLLYGKVARSSKSSSPGMSEPELSPLDMSTYNSLTSNNKYPPNVAAFKVLRGVEALGIHRGALLLVDLKAKPKSGDFVVATQHDDNSATSTTIIRRIIGSELVGSPIEPPEQIGGSTTVRGRIIKIIIEL